jgi:hypothetical protein
MHSYVPQMHLRKPLTLQELVQDELKGRKENTLVGSRVETLNLLIQLLQALGTKALLDKFDIPIHCHDKYQHNNKKYRVFRRLP